LLPMGSLPLKATVLVLLAKIVNPYFVTILSNLRVDFCNRISDSAVIT
jgi:hypothetical protein